MLACARIGVIHSVVYSGFSAPALQTRIHDCEAKVVITADVGYDRNKTIPLKPVVDEAVANCPTVEKVIVVQRETSPIPLKAPKEIGWEDWMKDQSPKCEAEHLDSEDTSLHSVYLRNNRQTERVSYMSMAGIWSAPTSRPNMCSISKKKMSIFASRIPAGSRAIVTLSMAPS